jgi:RND family efflux transporter MFP subunit
MTPLHHGGGGGSADAGPPEIQRETGWPKAAHYRVGLDLRHQAGQVLDTNAARPATLGAPSMVAHPPSDPGRSAASPATGPSSETASGAVNGVDSFDSRGVVRQRRRVWWAAALVSVVALGIAGAARLGAFDAAEDAPDGPAGRVPTVRTAVAKRSSLRLSMEQRGDLDAEVAELSSQVMGRVIEVPVDLGDHFERGSLLVRIDASQAQYQVAEARTQVLSADAALERAEAEQAAAASELERGRKLRAEQLISEEALDARSSAVAVARAQVATARAQQKQAAARVSLLDHEASETRLVAPFDGSVAARYLDPGSLVQPGARVLRLVQDGPLRVRFRIPERDVGHIEPGMPLEVTTQATGSRRFAGKVTRRSSEVSRVDRSVTVQGVLAGETPQLLPGMYATVHLELGQLENAVVVPSAAVVERETRDGPRTGVYRIEKGVARWQDVTVRGSSGDLTAVAPLAIGTEVVTLGPDTLRDGMPVRVAADEGP